MAASLAAKLPMGNAPAPVSFPHFPDRLHTYIWRNWSLVPVERIARVIGATREQIVQIGRAMGLPDPPRISADQCRRSYITVIRRNWHLLPYEQLLDLLGWSEEELAYTLQEDDFLFIKLGSLKPRCEPLHYSAPTAETLQREREIKAVVQQEFPNGLSGRDPLFSFVHRLSKPLHTNGRGEEDRGKREDTCLLNHRGTQTQRKHRGEIFDTHSSLLTPRFCFSYFALYGDPLLDPGPGPYPDGYLERLAVSGVDGVWLQGVLYKLAPFPWDPKLSDRYKDRLRRLRALVKRARKYGIGIYLYLNEPRSMPLSFFEATPHLRGVIEGDHAAMCTSEPSVQQYIVESVASICRAVPDLAGFFTITASENLTNCWSHHRGESCPRCSKRSGSEVIAEVNRLIWEGIRRSGSGASLIVYDWGWPDAWAEAIIEALPQEALLMSVSEWSIPIQRGGIESIIGEYAISEVGPGPRALRHWEIAQRRGMKTIAKIQAANTWELSSTPYIPALENVAQHIENLRKTGVNGLMLGWTLGGYPSPNLEVVAEMSRADSPPSPTEALQVVAERRFGPALAPAVVNAWRGFSAAFREFPYHIGVVYNAPQQLGPSNLLWEQPTGYRATMVGFPYDDLQRWQAVYPTEVFIAQFYRVAEGFERVLEKLKETMTKQITSLTPFQQSALAEELSVAEAAAIHFRSVANQARFVMTRNTLAQAKTPDEKRPLLDVLREVLCDEIALARRLFALQTSYSCLGFESSNQYYYVPLDLVEKVINCRDLLKRWLPAQE